MQTTTCILTLFLVSFIFCQQQQSEITAASAASLIAGNLDLNGPATSIQLLKPLFVSLDEKNQLLYISGNDLVRVMNLVTNSTSVVAGTGFSGYSGDYEMATSATLSNPTGIAMDSNNNLIYICDCGNNVVRVVNRTSGMITIFAGIAGQSGNGGDGGLATDSTLSSPFGIAIDSDNNLVYIADRNNNVIRVVNRTSGIITSNFPQLNLEQPSGIVMDSGKQILYVADKNTNLIRAVNIVTNTISK